MNPEQKSTITIIVDCCADIRRLYGALVLRGDNSQQQAYDTARMTSLEDDLAEYCDTAVAQGIEVDDVTGILERVLPPSRFAQFLPDDA